MGVIFMIASSNEFLASETFDTKISWQFENSVLHGEVVLHWFFSDDWVAVAVSNLNNHWLGFSMG